MDYNANIALRKQTRSLLEEFTYVALSKVCKPAWDKQQEERKKRIPSFLQNAWLFKDKPYKEKGLFAKKLIPEGTYLGTYGIVMGNDFDLQDINDSEEAYILRRLDSETNELDGIAL